MVALSPRSNYNSIYVQYGCAWSCPDGWLNFDSSPSVKLERLPLIGRFIKINNERFPKNIRIGDIVKGLPVRAGSANAVYASHVLEHLTLDDFWIALRNTFDMLAPGGIFRAIVPDLESRAAYYCSLCQKGNEFPSGQFMRLTNLGVATRNSGIVAAVRRIYGNSNHLWMWDYPSMQSALRKVGFEDIRRCTFNDSPEPMFTKVENRQRFYWSPLEEPNKEFLECAVEARKPQ